MNKYALGLILGLITTMVQAQVPSGYYTPANGLSGESLKTALYHIIKGHTQFPYTSASTDVWDILKETDRDPANSANVILLYSGLSVNAAQEYNNGNGWTREHVWAKSRGDFGTETGTGTDVHNLRPENDPINTARNNRWFAECSDMVYYNGVPTGSYTSSSAWIWKPRDAVKGDVARMIFYMATRYEGENGELDLEVIDYIPTDNYTTAPIHAKLQDLLLWHYQDPVDNFERNRNEVIYKYQMNRNPFIDHPEYVNAIWGGEPGNYIPMSPSDVRIEMLAASLKLSWTDVTNETSYLVFRSDDGNNYNLLGTSGEGINYYIDQEVSYGNQYWYYVLAANAQDTSEYINIAFINYQNASALFFSEYIEGSSYNKALEISNFTGSTIDLSAYTIKKQTNGVGNWSGGFSLMGALAHGGSFMLAYVDADMAITERADIVSSNGELSFNGNDPVSLWKNDQLIDVIGVYNNTSVFAEDVTLVRKATVKSPVTSYDATEWTVLATDNFNNWGFHVFGGYTACPVPENLNYSFLSANSVKLVWAACGDAKAYRVRYKTLVSSSWTELEATQNNYELDNLSYATEYEFQVAATCGEFTTQYSVSNLFTTLAENSNGIKMPEWQTRVYPNPAKSVLYVENMQGALLEIFSLSGQLMQQTFIAGDSVDVSLLPWGMYILRITKDGLFSYQRLMKE